MIIETIVAFGFIVITSLLAKKYYFSGGKCTSKTRLDNKTVIITGANGGIGYETALELAKRGAHVILACRDLKRAQQAANKIIQQTQNTNIEVEQIDLADLKSVRQFADKMNKKLDKLDVLINNAGVMQCPYWRTKDNFELQFGTNHLAHFLLSHLLLDLLEKNKSSRIINVSSIAHVFGQINWDDINCEFEKDYSPLARYNQSKLANVLFAYEASQRFKNIISVSLHPGLVRTDIMRHAELGGSATISLGFISKLFFPFWYIVSKSAWEGAQTTLHCALDDSVLNYNGYYFADCKPKLGKTINAEDAKKLWELSANLVKL